MINIFEENLIYSKEDNNISTLQNAIWLATERHKGQMDKAGEPYIHHPLRVMQNVQHPEAKITAVLHDILEDTMTSVEELRSLGFKKSIINAVLAVTKKKDENRFQAVQRTVKNAIACEVKLADLSDNMDLSRLSSITTKDQLRYQQYLKVKDILVNASNIHNHIASLNLGEDYPKFHYQSLQLNYQFLLNAMFDEKHDIGGINIGSPQEWWILFEDVSTYFSYCKRKRLVPLESAYLQLINDTDSYYFGGMLQTLGDQMFLKILFKNFIQFHFKKG